MSSIDDGQCALIRDLAAAICQLSSDRPPPASDVYRALCASWRHRSGTTAIFTWRDAADITYGLLGSDCYLAGREGLVAPDLAELLSTRGWSAT